MCMGRYASIPAKLERVELVDSWVRDVSALRSHDDVVMTSS